MIDEPILFLTADNICELDLNFIQSEYLRLKEPACMLVPVRKIDGIEGDFINSKDYIVNSISRHVPTDCYASGIQVLNPSKVIKVTQETEDFGELWEQLMSVNQLYRSEVYTKPWFSVDTIEQLSIISRKNK